MGKGMDYQRAALRVRAARQDPAPPERYGHEARDWWTPERLVQLSELHETEATAQAIADVMGTTKNAVVGKLHRLGIYSRPRRMKHSSGKGPDTKLGITPGFEAPGPKPGECAYIAGDPRVDRTHCGKPTGLRRDGTPSSYCQKHHDLCWIPALSKRGKAALKAFERMGKIAGGAPV